MHSRFYVIQDPDAGNSIKYDESQAVAQSSISNQQWWNCIPKIVCNAFGVGCIEVQWASLPIEQRRLISHYQLFLNGVSYRANIDPRSNRVRVKGLAGGRNYDATLMVYPKDVKLLPQQSNVVVVKAGRTTNLGGPIISLKANSREDQITLTWQSIHTAKCPISCYELIINEEKRDVVCCGFIINYLLSLNIEKKSNFNF
jgi:hypothetical protein